MSARAIVAVTLGDVERLCLTRLLQMSMKDGDEFLVAMAYTGEWAKARHESRLAGRYVVEQTRAPLRVPYD